jgi:hypothetical protein
MPIVGAGTPKFKKDKIHTADWKDFSDGLNSYLRETEISRKEMVTAKDLMLVGAGVPTKRWGSADYFLTGSNATGMVRGMRGLYQSDGTNELVALSDHGYLVKKANASYTILTGASWASGYDAQMTQLNDTIYVVDGNKEITKYDGTNVTRFTELTQPGGLSATNLSGVSGTFTYSWRVSAENDVGETLATTAVSLANMPQEPSDTLVRLTWTTSSPASSVTGYVVYGRDPGNESWLARTESGTLLFDDYGTLEPSLIAEPPTADTTGGPIAKYMIRHDNRLVIAGVSGNPSRVMFTGKGGNSEKFHWSQGGGYIDIDKNSGDDITGLGVFEESIIVFKENSVWEMQITNIELGDYTLAYPVAIPITHSHGCISGKTIQAVENDVFYLSRDGVYTLGYEESILNALRTNEISVKIRDFVQSMSYADLQAASSSYIDKKYTLSFPSVKKTMIYDRERVAWTGPANTPYQINNWYTYKESDGTEQWLAGTDDGFVVEFDSNYKNDRGTAFTTELKTKKEDYGSWGSFKNIDDLMMLFRDISGTVNVEIIVETRDGSTNIAKNFSISTSSTDSGWGSSQWGDNQWADSDEAASASDITEYVRRVIMRETVRSIQLRLTTSMSTDDYELLGISVNAKAMGRGSLPYSYNI